MRDKSEWYKGVPFGCGQCLPCRINRRRIWCLRMALEFLAAGKGLFITLTYADENLPYSISPNLFDCLPSLCKRDFQLFMKRFRKAVAPTQIRFFACGEYGSKTLRPHYHAILFGVDSSQAEKVAECWPYGMVACGECNAHTIQYVAGYVLKKLVNPKEEGEFRTPEFTLSSRNPGLGSVAIPAIADALKKYPQLFDIGNFGEDVPGSLSVLGKKYPLGRYLIHKLRSEMGIDEDKESFSYIEEMRDRFFNECKTPSPALYDSLRYQPTDSILAALLMSEDQGRARLQEGKLKIFNRRNKI